MAALCFFIIAQGSGYRCGRFILTQSSWTELGIVPADGWGSILIPRIAAIGMLSLYLPSFWDCRERNRGPNGTRLPCFRDRVLRRWKPRFQGLRISSRNLPLSRRTGPDESTRTISALFVREYHRHAGSSLSIRRCGYCDVLVFGREHRSQAHLKLHFSQLFATQGQRQ
jgi:hypothetical protein